MSEEKHIVREFVGLTGEHPVENAIIKWSMVSVLFVLMLSLVAPVLGPWFRKKKLQEYAMYPDYEQRVKADMVGVYIGLTIWAILAWSLLIWLSHG